MKFIRAHSLEWGIVFLYLIPPLGIAWLMVKGWYHLYQYWIVDKTIQFTVGTFFFGSLVVSSMAGAILLRNIEYFAYTGMILGYFGIYLHVKKKVKLSDIRRYKWLVIFGGLYMFLFGNLQLYLHEKLHFTNQTIGLFTGGALLGDNHYDRLFGDAYNPNFASFLLLIALAFLLTDLLNKQNGRIHVKKLIIKLAILPILITSIVETQSREGFVTMVVILFVFIFRYRWKIGLVILATVPLFYHWWLHLVPRVDTRAYSLRVRENIWLNSLHIWSNHPIFGITPLGFGNEYRALFGKNVAHAHNIALAYLSEYGVLGEVAFLFLVIVSVYKFIQIFFFTKAIEKDIGNLFLFALCIIPLTGIFDFPMFSPQVMFVTVILLAIWDHFTFRLEFFSKKLKSG